MHPVTGLGRIRRGPLNAARIEQVHVPRRARRRQHAPICVAEPIGFVPVLLRAFVGYELRRAGDVPAMCS